MAPIDRRIYLDQLGQLDIHRGGSSTSSQETPGGDNRPALDPAQDSLLRRRYLPPAEAVAADELERAVRGLDVESEESCRQLFDIMWQPRFREWHWLDDESDGYRGSSSRGSGEDDRYAETNFDGLCWAGVFDAIDEVLERYIQYTHSGEVVLLAAGTQLGIVDEVIIELLRWSKIVLVSNSQATLLYNSFDRLMSLLDSPHPRIIIAALDVLWNYNYSTTNIFKRVVHVANTQSTSMDEGIQKGMRMRLSWLSEGWESYNPSYDVLCCCCDDHSRSATASESLDPQIVRSTAISLPKSVEFVFDYQQPVTHEMKSIHCTLVKGQQGVTSADELMEKLKNTVTEESVLTMLRYRLRHALALLEGDRDMMLLFTAIRLCTVDITLQIRPHHTPPPCGNMGIESDKGGRQPPAWGPSGIGSGFLHMYLQTYPAFLGQLAALPFSAVSYAETVKRVPVARALPIEVETVLLWSYRLMSTVLMEASLLGAGGQQLVVVWGGTCVVDNMEILRTDREVLIDLSLASSSNLGYMNRMIQGSRDRLVNALKEEESVEGVPPQRQARYTQSLTVCSECIDVMTNLITAMQYPNMMVTVNNISMILDFLIRLSTHEIPIDWHHNTVLALVSCCKCLEIALEYSPGCFGILFRDLNGLDRLLDVVAALSKDCYDCWTSTPRGSSDGVAGGNDYEKMLILSNRRNELQAVLNLLKTSVHNIDPGVGMNLNEALSGREVEETEAKELSEDSVRRRREGFQKVMVRVFGEAGEAIGAHNVGYLAQLLHYICDNDPIIIPTVLGPNGELLKAVSKCLPAVRNSSFALGWTSTTLSSFSLHNKGAELLRDLQGEDNPLTRLVRLVIMGDGAGVRPVSPLAEKVTSDLPMMLSQSIEDIVRNRGELAKPLVEAAIGGLEDLLAWADKEEPTSTSGILSAKLAPACRLLASLLQTHSSLAKLLVMEDVEGGGKSSKPGQHLCELLVKLATHPSLPKGGSILAPVVMAGPTANQQQQQHPHYHPIVSTFRALENAFYNNLGPSLAGSSSSSTQTDSGDCLLPLASLVVENGQKLIDSSPEGAVVGNTATLSALTFGLETFALVHAPVKESGGGLFGSSASPAGASTRDYLSYSLLAVIDTVCKCAPRLLERLATGEGADQDGPAEVKMDLTLQLNSPPNQVRRSRFMRDTIDWRKAVEMSAIGNSSGSAPLWLLWSTMKKFMEAVAKLANTPSGRIKRVHDMFFSSLSQKQISNSARIASVLLSGAFIDMTKRYGHLQEKVDEAGRLSSVKKGFATEMFELLAKCHVEDRSHHTRVLSIDTMFKMGGFGDDFTGMVVDILRDPCTDEALSASVLGYCERITSVKRMENSNLTQPSLFPTIDKNIPASVQSFLKVDGYKLVSSLQVRLTAALLPLWRDDDWLGREGEKDEKGERRYVMSARACGSMVKLFTHAVEPDPRVIDGGPTATPSPPDDGQRSGDPTEAAIAEMLRVPNVQRLGPRAPNSSPGEDSPPAVATAGQGNAPSQPPAGPSEGGSSSPVGDPVIDLHSSSAAHFAVKENLVAILQERVPTLKKEEGLDLPSKLTPADVRKNAEDVGRDFITRCVFLSKKGGQPTHCADVISRVAQNCNRIRLGSGIEGQGSETMDETTRLKIHVGNLLHVVDVVTDEFVKEINVLAEEKDENSPDAMQCLSHVLAFLTNTSERVRATLWKGGKAEDIIQGYCHYCEKKVDRVGADDKMADASSWLETMLEEAEMLGRSEEGVEGGEVMPLWLTEAALAIEGLCDEPYIYTGDWDALQKRLLAALVSILTRHEEKRSSTDPLKLAAVMVPSPDLTRAALEVMSLLVNREVNASAVFGSAPWKLLSILSLRRSSSYPEITSMLASVLSKLMENKQFIAAVVDLALNQLNKEGEKKKRSTAPDKKGRHRHHHHHQQNSEPAKTLAEVDKSTGGASDKASEGGKKPSQKPPARSLSYKLSDILANPMMKSLVLKDPKTVEEVLLKDLMKKRKTKATSTSSSTADEDGQKEETSVMVLLDTKDDNENFLTGLSTNDYPYSILVVVAEFLLRSLQLLQAMREDSADTTPSCYPLAVSVEGAMYFLDTLLNKLQFASQHGKPMGSITLTPLPTTCSMLLDKPIRVDDFIITTVGEKLSSLKIGLGSGQAGGGNMLKSAFHLISSCWTELCASCTPSGGSDDAVVEWYKSLSERLTKDPFVKYSRENDEDEDEELAWVLKTYRRFSLLYALLLKASEVDGLEKVLERERKQHLAWECNEVLGSIMLHRPYSADLSEAVLACMEILTRPPTLPAADHDKEKEEGESSKAPEEEDEDVGMDDDDDDEDSSPSVIYHFGPPAGFLLDEDDDEDDEDDDDELIPTMIVEPVVNEDDAEGQQAGGEENAAAAAGDDGGEDGQNGDNAEEWADDDVYNRLEEAVNEDLLDDLDDDDDDDEEDDDDEPLVPPESEIHPAESQPDELEEERDMQLEREQMENIDPDDIDEEEEDDDDDSDDEGSGDDDEDIMGVEEEEGSDDDEEDVDGDVMDVLRDVVMSAAAPQGSTTTTGAGGAAAAGGSSSVNTPAPNRGAPNAANSTATSNATGDGDHQAPIASDTPHRGGEGQPSGGSSSGSSSDESGSSSSSGDGHIVIEFDDGHNDDMMDEEEEDDDEEDDDEDESSDDEGEEEEGSDDEDAIPLLGFDGDAPHGRMYRRNYPRGSGGGSHLLLPMLEDGPGRALGIRDLLPRRRGSGGTIGGPMGADRVNTNPNAIPPSAMLSTQSLLLPRPPRKVWSFTNQEGNPDKSVGRYSAVHPFFEGRQNNRMPPLVVRPHGDLGASNDPSSTNDGAEVDLITGVVEPPTSRSLTSMLCNRVQEAVAAGLKEEPEAPPTTPSEPSKAGEDRRRRRSRSEGGDTAVPKKKARRLSRRRSRRGDTPADTVGEEEEEGTQARDAEEPQAAPLGAGVEGGSTSAAAAAAVATDTTADAGASAVPESAAPIEAAAVDTSQYPQACIDAANRMRVPVGEVVSRSGMDLSVLVELPPDLQREAIIDAVGTMDEGVLTQLRNEYRQQNPQQDGDNREGEEDGTAAADAVAAANEAADFLNALPPDLRREALISMQLDDPTLLDALPSDLRMEARAASAEVEQRRRHQHELLRRPRRRWNGSAAAMDSSAQQGAQEQTRRLRAMGDSIRGAVDNVMHTTSSSTPEGNSGAPRQVGTYLSPFSEEGGGSASFYEDLLAADDGPLISGRRFGSGITQRLNTAGGASGHQQLAAIIREFESVAENSDMFLFDASRGNRRGGTSFAISGPGMDADSAWGPAAAFIGRPQGRRRQDLGGGDWASASSVRTLAQASPGGVAATARRNGPMLTSAAMESLNLGLQAPLRIITTRGSSPASGTGGGQAIDRSWLQNPLQTEEIAHMYSSGSCPRLLLWGDLAVARPSPSSAGPDALAEGAKHLLRLLFMRYQPLRPLVDKTIFNICLDPRLEDAVLQVLVQALLSLACSNNRRHSHSVHGWSFLVDDSATSSNGKITTTTINDDNNNDEPFPPWYLYESPMLPSGPGRSPTATGVATDNTAPSSVTASPTVRALARSVGCGRVLNAISFLISTIPRTRQWFASPSMIHNALLQRSSSSSTLARTVSNSSPSPKRSTSGVKRRRSSMTPAEAPEVRRSKRLSRTQSVAVEDGGEASSSGSVRKLQRTKSSGGKEGGKATMSEEKVEGAPAAAAHHHQQKRASQPILVAPVNVVMQLLGSPLLRSSPAHTLFLVTVLVSMLTPPSQSAAKSGAHHNNGPPPPRTSSTPAPAAAAAEEPAASSTAEGSTKPGAKKSTASPKKARTTTDIVRMHVRHLQRAVSGSSVSALCAFLANDNPSCGCQVKSTELDKALAKTSTLIQALAATGDRHRMVIRKQLLVHVRQLSSKVASMLTDLAVIKAERTTTGDQQEALRDTASATLFMTSKRLLRVVQCWSDALIPKGHTLSAEAEETAEKEFDQFLTDAHVDNIWPGLDEALTRYDNDPKVLQSQLASVSRAQAALEARRENEDRHREQQQQYARSGGGRDGRNPISPHHDSLDRVERPERAVAAQQQGDAPRTPSRHLPSGLTSLLPVIELYLMAKLPTKSDRLKVASARRGMVAANGATSPRAGALTRTPSASSSSKVEAIDADESKKAELLRQSRAVATFCESHRRPLNALIKNQPSLLLRALNPIVYAAPQALDFDNKRQFFRSKLKEQSRKNAHVSGPPIRLHVRRHEVFVDSYHQLQHRKKSEMMNKIIVQFVGEEGVDAGGLIREWFGILAREVFNPNYALFLPANGRPSTFLINPASSVNPDHLSFFRFCGRIIGKAIYENQRLDCYFVRSFYKHMLGRPVTWHDMEAMDPDYYRNLKWILECQDEEMLKALDLTFTIEESDFGKTNVVELIPNGSNIPVTLQNRQEYVQKVCEHKMTSGIQDQLQAFLEGFHELVPADLVGTLFDDKELELLIAGLPTIDVEDLKKNTEYVNYSSQDPQIKWFWKCLEENFTEDEMAWFLQFVTGSTQVPLEGFKALTGMRGPQKFSIHKAPGDKTRLPSAHTCFNQLDLPDYDTEEVLKAKLKQAVCEAHEGFGFV